MNNLFPTRESAEYWGGGVITPTAGGFASLHAVPHPNGVRIYHIDASGEHPGWPRDSGHVWATPGNGGRPCICRVSGT